ncbi:hypothetical protein SHAM105786_15485 [Shewanella amazonensis]
MLIEGTPTISYSNTQNPGKQGGMGAVSTLFSAFKSRYQVLIVSG